MRKASKKAEQGFHTIGIGSELDWPRIKKLLRIGLFAGCLVFVSDMLLGYGVSSPQLFGLEGVLSKYLGISDKRIFWSAFLGIIGIPLEGLCYFGIYRLMAGTSPRHAHQYRSGIFGYLIFGGCGVHLPCLAAVYFYNHMMQASPATAQGLTLRFVAFFLVPACILFFVFMVLLCTAQISAFAKGKTPYPRWCWVFSLPIGMAFALLIKLLSASAFANGIAASWISIGNIWMFGGLIVFMKKAQRG